MSKESAKGIVIGFEYDPQRTVPLVQLYNPSENTFSYRLATGGIKPFSEIETKKASLDEHINKSEKNLKGGIGSISPLSTYEPGDFIHSVELFNGQGPTVARSAGSFCQVRSNYISDSGATKFIETATQRSFVKVRLPSGSQRLISSDACATFGIPEFNGYHQRPSKKAGRTR